jgi:hypothetical protein
MRRRNASRARHGFQTPGDVAHETVDRVRRLERRRVERHLEGHEPRRAESALDRAQRQERPREKARVDEQHDGHRDLRDHERRDVHRGDVLASIAMRERDARTAAIVRGDALVDAEAVAPGIEFRH